MKKQNIKDKILSRFRANFLAGKHGLVYSQKIEDVMHELTGHKHEYIGIQLRVLAEEKKLKVEYDKEHKNTAMYQYIPSELEILSYEHRR